MTVDTSSCVAMTKEDIEAKSSKLSLDKMEASELTRKITEYEAKVMRLKRAIDNPDISREKRELLESKLQNRTEAYYLMVKQLEAVM